MKTIKILGKSVPVFALILAGLATIGTAALVAYLSNSITATMNVDSPLAVTINDATAASFNVYGGEPVSFKVTIENKASVPITGKAEIIVSSPGITCGDFSSVLVNITSEQPKGTVVWSFPATPIGGACIGDATNCCEQQVNKISYRYGEVTDVYSPGRLDTMYVIATFEPTALGTYTATIQILPV